VVRQKTDGTFEYRFAGGELLRFDSSRRLVAILDHNGNATTLGYTGTKLTSVTNAVGRSLSFQYNSDGFVERVTDPLGRRWLYTYATNGTQITLATVTDPLDNVVQYTFSGGHLVSIRDGRDKLVKQISYDGARVTQQTFADGGFERYSYETSGTVVTAVKITYSSGRTETKRFNAAGYVIGMQDGLGQMASFNRDILTNQTLSVAGSCGCAQLSNEFDARGNTIASTNRLGQTRHWEYEPVFNKVTKAIDALGHETNFTYDSHGNLPILSTIPLPWNTTIWATSSQSSMR
jgi:YD repeat-containing protein